MCTAFISRESNEWKLDSWLLSKCSRDVYKTQPHTPPYQPSNLINVLLFFYNWWFPLPSTGFIGEPRWKSYCGDKHKNVSKIKDNKNTQKLKTHFFLQNKLINVVGYESIHTYIRSVASVEPKIDGCNLCQIAPVDWNLMNKLLKIDGCN